MYCGNRKIRHNETYVEHKQHKSAADGKAEGQKRMQFRNTTNRFED